MQNNILKLTAHCSPKIELQTFAYLTQYCHWTAVFVNSVYAQSAGAVEYTDCFSANGVKTHPRRVSGYDTKQSEDEVSVMLELWGTRSIPSLTSLPGPLWLREVVRGLSMDQIELKCALMLNWIAWKRTVLIFRLRTYAKLNCLN